MSISIWQAGPEDRVLVKRLLPGIALNGPVLLMQKEGAEITDAAGTRIVDGKYAVLELVHESSVNENMMGHFLRLWMAANEHLDALYVRSQGAHPVFLHDGFAVVKDLSPSVAELIGDGAALVKTRKKWPLLIRKEVNSRAKERVQQRAVGANGC